MGKSKKNRKICEKKIKIVINKILSFIEYLIIIMTYKKVNILKLF